MGGKVVLDNRVLVQLQKDLTPRARQLLSKVAFDVQAGAQDRAPVDTGFLKNSIYVSLGWLKSSNRFGMGGMNQAKRAGKKSGNALQEMDASEKSALVVVGAEYGIYVEMGTRKMRAHPFLIPALEAVKPKFLAAWKELVKQ